MSIAVELSVAVGTPGQQSKVVELREPSVKDVRELGYPFIVVQGKSGAGGMEINPDTIIRYAARLSANPPSAFDNISLGDLSSLQTAVMGFFGDEAEASPS